MALSRFLEGLSQYISGLSEQKQESIAASLVRRAINENLNIDTTYDLFSRRGFTIERSRFEGIYTNTEQRELNSQRVKYLRQRDVPTEDILYPSFSLEDNRYNFGFQYSLWDDTDEKYHTKFFFIETDDLMTRGELEQMALSELRALYESVEGDVINVGLRYGEINVRSIR